MKVPAHRVSRNRKAPTECKPVRVAVVRVQTPEATISCGWHKAHNRTKVLENAVQRHLDKKHGGSGLWL